MSTHINFPAFALSLYAQPSAEAECLHLQDTYKLSVPLILCCAWLDFRGKGATVASLLAVPKAVLAWEQKVVWPLRQLRREMKQDDVSASEELVRLKIKQAELAAEMEVLKRLGELPWPATSELALNSMARLANLPNQCDSFGALRAGLTLLKRDTLTGQTN